MKRLLVLGGAAKSEQLLKTAKARGHFVVLCDRDPSCPGRKWSDVYENVSTLNRAAILAIAKRHKIEGVLSYGSDIMALEVAWHAETLGLPGNPSKTVETMVRKDLFREFLAHHKFPVPASYTVTSDRPCDWPASDLRLPVIVKPVDGAGSAGVSRVDNWHEITASINQAKNASRSGHVIVEEFLERDHPAMIGGDIFVQDGQVIFWGLLDSHRAAAFSPYVPTGTSYPVTLDNSALVKVKIHLQQLVSALDYSSGPINVELMFGTDGRLYTIELAPRNGGNDIPCLLELATGVDMLTLLLQSTFVECIQVNSKNSIDTVFSNYMIYSSRPGVFQKVTVKPEFLPYFIDIEVTAQSGDIVQRFDKATDSFGTLWLRFDSESPSFLSNPYLDDKIDLQIKII